MLTAVPSPHAHDREPSRSELVAGLMIFIRDEAQAQDPTLDAYLVEALRTMLRDGDTDEDLAIVLTALCCIAAQDDHVGHGRLGQLERDLAAGIQAEQARKRRTRR